MLSLLCRLLAVLSCALEAQTAQAHVHPVLCVGAVPCYFPEEAAGVAFFECGDDFGAAYKGLLDWSGGWVKGYREVEARSRRCAVCEARVA